MCNVYEEDERKISIYRAIWWNPVAIPLSLNLRSFCLHCIFCAKLFLFADQYAQHISTSAKLVRAWHRPRLFSAHENQWSRNRWIVRSTFACKIICNCRVWMMPACAWALFFFSAQIQWIYNVRVRLTDVPAEQTCQQSIAIMQVPSVGVC